MLVDDVLEVFGYRTLYSDGARQGYWCDSRSRILELILTSEGLHINNWYVAKVL